MPIGPYRDWAECISRNQDKDDPAAYCGALERDARSMDGMWVVADVIFDSDAEAREAERLVREDKLTGVSVDLGNVTSEIEILDVDEEGFPIDWLETLTQGEILGATQVAMPAFADARIVEEDGQLVAYLAPEGITTSDRRLIAPQSLTWREKPPLMFNDTSDGHDGAVFVGNLQNFRRVGQPALVASGANPQLAGVTRPFVQDGKLVGHGAQWGTCHLNQLAERGVCMTPPSGVYEAGEAKVYKHPRGDIHAPIRDVGGRWVTMEEAERWYETHCEEVGRVKVGEDDHGIWVHGETNLPEGEYFLSGDWRNVDGELQLNSFLVVEHPAYPLALAAADSQMALLNAGVVETSDELVDRVARLERIVEDYRSEKQAELFTKKLADLDEAFEISDDEIETLADSLDF